MTDSITLTGIVATAPRHIVTAEGLTISSFRLASAQRRFDRSQEKWIDVDTNWYTITAFRQLGVNCAGSISKGDRVLVTGRLKIREWVNGERTGTTVDIEADAIGHDLSWGTSVFSRTIATSRISATSDAPVDQSEDAADSWAIDSSGDESEGSGQLLAGAGTAIPDESEAVPVPF